MLLTKLRVKLTGQPLGLEKLPKDERDLNLGFLWFGGYEPLHKRKEIKTLSVKSQKHNTCGWNSSTTGKEVDEGVKLSPRSLVILGKELGYISGDGFSNLRNNEKTLQKYGVAEERFLSEKNGGWVDYSNSAKLTPAARANAATHRSQTYWSITNIDGILKALDDDRIVKVGVKWYRGLNMSAGFKTPWFWGIVSWFVGWHAMIVVGYDMDYKGQKVAILQNSFGGNYGDNGKMYIKFADLEKQIREAGAYANYDMPLEIGKWLIEHQGHLVKTNGGKDVYLIQGNQKRKYTDEATLTAHGKAIADIINVEAEYLDKVERGEDILFWDGGNVKQVREMVRQYGQFKELYSTYFNELF